jgi:PKD repeat protein
MPRGVRLTQIIVALTSIVTIISMIAIATISLLMNNQDFRNKYGIDNNITIRDDTASQLVAREGQTEVVIVPVVTLSTDKPTVSTGEKASLTWSVSDNTSRCIASDDWSGDKSSQGTEETAVLDKVQVYVFTLTCSTKTGTSFAITTVAVGGAVPQGNQPAGSPPPVQTVTQPPVTQTTGTGSVALRPKVTLTASPSSVTVGGAATLNWSVTNNPTSCTAGGSWTGSKASSGSQNTGALSATGTKSYSLTCANAGGSETVTVAVVVSASIPVVVAPAVSLSISPSTILSGASATLTWSVTNNPTSCTAGGSWTGSKASSGSQSTGAKTTGTYTYTLTCANSGGTGTRSVNLTVNPAPVYCSGMTPCYGRSDLAAHASVGNCWAWNNTWVINITSYSPVHKGGILSGSTSTLENAAATCNHDINAILRGSASISGYKDKRANPTFAHRSDTINNTSLSALIGYRVGYYDASKP